MAAIKSATLTVRIDPGPKEALRVAAEGGRRSIANLIEVLIRDYCTHNDIDIPLLGAKTSIQRSKKTVKQ